MIRAFAPGFASPHIRRTVLVRSTTLPPGWNSRIATWSDGTRSSIIPGVGNRDLASAIARDGKLSVGIALPHYSPAVIGVVPPYVFVLEGGSGRNTDGAVPYHIVLLILVGAQSQGIVWCPGPELRDASYYVDELARKSLYVEPERDCY